MAVSEARFAPTSLKNKNFLDNIKMPKIESEKLISEVEKRPALWDMRTKEYSDRIVKKQCWKEIGDLFATEEMTVAQRNELGK